MSGSRKSHRASNTAFAACCRVSRSRPDPIRKTRTSNAFGALADVSPSEETIEALTLKGLYRRSIRDIKKQMTDLEAKLDAKIEEEDSYLMAAEIVRAE